ncbi:uncharacterized protein LOC116166504 [Photinus pyralis]|nr:uncharacterized protein LOC116166504 [Photinus pyralis]
MYAAFLIFASIAFVLAQFYQDRYDIVHDRMEVQDHNNSFLLRPNIQAVYYNKSMKMKVLNASGFVTSPLKNNIMMDFKFYRFASGAYRIIPFNITIDLCDQLKRNMFGLSSIVQYSNFRGCPFPGGLLYLRYYPIEQDKFPPFLPLGKYKLSITVHVNDGHWFVGITNWYGSLVAKGRN